MPYSDPLEHRRLLPGIAVSASKIVDGRFLRGKEMGVKGSADC